MQRWFLCLACQNQAISVHVYRRGMGMDLSSIIHDPTCLEEGKCADCRQGKWSGVFERRSGLKIRDSACYFLLYRLLLPSALVLGCLLASQRIEKPENNTGEYYSHVFPINKLHRTVPTVLLLSVAWSYHSVDAARTSSQLRSGSSPSPNITTLRTLRRRAESILIMSDKTRVELWDSFFHCNKV